MIDLQTMIFFLSIFVVYPANVFIPGSVAGGNTDHYTHGLELDYPSISHINSVAQVYTHHPRAIIIDSP
jgi:hypothetical protein